MHTKKTPTESGELAAGMHTDEILAVEEAASNDPHHPGGQGAEHGGGANFYGPIPPGTAVFTQLRYTSPIGKRFFLDSAGRLQKVETSAQRTQAVAHIAKCSTIGQVEAAFRAATDSDIFVAGVPYADGLPVVSKAERSEQTIARTVKDLPFPKGPGVMFIDNDYPVDEGDDQFRIYIEACPALRAASYVYAPSSSAWLYDTGSGAELKGRGGQHYAVPVQDATDIPRALKALHDRLVLIGYGQTKITTAGTVLIKSQVDTALQTPNQPLFHRVSLGAGLEQRKTEHIGSRKGEVFLFDTTLITDLTPEEKAQQADIERLLRVSVADEASKVRGAWIKEHVESVATKNGLAREAAAEVLRTALTRNESSTRFDLFPGIEIRFADGGVDVGELLANPGAYDGKPCADPLEPEYGSGVGVAKFYANEANGKPLIRSHAHGGQTFFLHHDPKDVDLDGILNQAERKNAEGADENVTDQPMEVKPKLKSLNEVNVWKAMPVVVPGHLTTFPTARLNSALGWFNRCAEDTVNSISMASVIHLAAVITARGAATNMNNHPSLFLLLIAPTGYGKNYGKNAVVHLLQAAGVEFALSGEFHSKGGVYSAMLDSPTVFFHLDEFGDLIRLGIKDGSPLSGAFSYLKQVYSASGSVLPALTYATATLTKKRASEIRAIAIKNPCVNLYCLSTPGQFFAAIDNASVEGGFLNRFVGVVAGSDRVYTNETPVFDPPTDLVEHVIEVRQYLTGEGNLGSQKFTNCEIAPLFRDYEFDVESRVLLDAFKQEINSFMGDDFMLDMAARWRENAMRVALALHVFSTPAVHTIHSTVTQWCIDYVRFYCGQFAKLVLEHAQPKSEYGRQRRDFLLAFRKRPEGTPPSDLGRHPPWKNVPTRTRNEIIDDLTAAGLLAEVAKPYRGQRGPQGKIYVALAD